MAKWVGYAVSVSCGEPLGCYQGTILEADGLTITLTKAFRNGFPYNKSQVTINAADIKDLKIIEPKSTESSGQTHSTIAITKNNKKCQKATVCENLQAIPSTSGGQSGPVNNKQQPRNNGAGPARSKPIDIQGNKNKNNNIAGGNGSFGAQASSTPRSRGAAAAGGSGGAGGSTAGGAGGAGSGGAWGQRRRNEACFGADMDPALQQDFDFEKNLALFDKQALWEQMRNTKPDLVPYECTAKFRHDENVLGSVPAPTRAIRVPDRARAPQDYVTDEGVVVPSVLAAWRRALWAALQRSGMMDSASVLLARAAADVALRLVGGGRRLDPRNAHQVPTVVALVGSHRIGACGVTAARLLLSHGARTAVLPCGTTPDMSSDVLRRALGEYVSCGGRVAACADELPSADLLLLATHDVEQGEGGDCSAALRWARGARAAVVCLEPPAAGYPCPAGAAVLSARAAVCALLPPPLAPRLGRLYLADVAPPAQVFAELGVDYKPPFGACSVLALHPNDDADADADADAA